MSRRGVRKPKWAHLHEIDMRTRVGTPAWRRRNSPGARKLSAWRRLHMLPNGLPQAEKHTPVRAFARSKGKSPSSMLSTPQMVKRVKQLEAQQRPGYF